MNFLVVLILAVVLLAIAFAGFAINILIKKGGKFPNTHISSNKYLQDQGISCAQSYDKMEQQKARKQIKFDRLNIDTLRGNSAE
ncbi:MAG: hypothetical protein ACOZDD_05060 [Bacteroidota bacterium]